MPFSGSGSYILQKLVIENFQTNTCLSAYNKETEMVHFFNNEERCNRYNFWGATETRKI
jgi:hypothetical protein